MVHNLSVSVLAHRFPNYLCQMLTLGQIKSKEDETPYQSVITLYFCREASFAIPKCGFWHKDYFKWTEDSGSFSCFLPLSCLRNLERGPGPERALSPERYPQRFWARCGGEHLSGPRDQSPTLYHTASVRPSKHLFTKHLLFHLHSNCLPPLWNPNP